MSDNETKQTFWEHLDVLRGALIKILAIYSLIMQTSLGERDVASIGGLFF